MDIRERVARKLMEQYNSLLVWEDLDPRDRIDYLSNADQLIVLIREPEHGDVHYAAAMVLQAAAVACDWPSMEKNFQTYARRILDSRGAVGGAWGRKTARALLQLPQEADDA